MRATLIVYRKELREILRDRRTLIAIALAALATPVILFVVSQVSIKTAAQAYTIGYSGNIPAGLDVLFNATGLKLERVDDPAEAGAGREDQGPAARDQHGGRNHGGQHGQRVFRSIEAGQPVHERSVIPNPSSLIPDP